MDRLEVYLLAAENSVGKQQRRLLAKRKRAGEVLTREQVKAIKKGRKLLKSEMKERGLKTKEDFELMATSMGLYFDKNPLLGIIPWLFGGKGMWLLLGALALLLAAVFGFSIVSQLQGHFTINMSDGMFKEGFTLSDSIGFENPTTQLFCEAAENVPCISIAQIPGDVNDIDGQHNEAYFAYTFYVRNEGESTVGYDWNIRFNSESLNLSTACWVMVFEDGEMSFYAEADENGQVEALPAFDDNTRGYLDPMFMKYSKNPEEQFQVIQQGVGHAYYRLVPYAFTTESVVATGQQEHVAPMEVHKYTVVIWLEGDDPDCTDELIGGHVGMDFNFKLISEDDDSAGAGTQDGRSIDWEELWENLKFW